jgi:hypothetical protein
MTVTNHPLAITLNGTTCTQNLDNTGAVMAPVVVPVGDTVTFQAYIGPTPQTTFTVAFGTTAPASCGSPFGGCTTTFSQSAATGQVGVVFPYSFIAIGNPSQTCTNAGSLGLIMR